MSERNDRLLAAGLAGMTYEDFIASESEPPVGRDEDAQPREHDSHDGDDAEGSPVSAPRADP